MDGKFIEVDIEVESGDYRRILFWYNKTKLIVNGIVVAILFLILMALVGLIGLSNSSRGLTWAMLLPVAFPALLVSVVFFLTIFNIIKQASSVVATTEPTRAIFGENEVQMISASSTATTLWSKFVKLKETETDFIFFLQERVFYPVPKRFFLQPNEIEELREIIRRNLGDKAELKG